MKTKRSFIPAVLVLVLLVSVIFNSPVFALTKGQVVCAKWGGSFYLATVTAQKGEQWQVLYADGDSATLNEKDIRELPWDPKLKEGDTVWAVWNNGGKFFSGTVLEVCQLSFKVKWADGSATSWVPATKILKR